MSKDNESETGDSTPAQDYEDQTAVFVEVDTGAYAGAEPDPNASN